MHDRLLQPISAWATRHSFWVTYALILVLWEAFQAGREFQQGHYWLAAFMGVFAVFFAWLVRIWHRLHVRQAIIRHTVETIAQPDGF